MLVERIADQALRKTGRLTGRADMWMGDVNERRRSEETAITNKQTGETELLLLVRHLPSEFEEY